MAHKFNIGDETTLKLREGTYSVGYHKMIDGEWQWVDRAENVPFSTFCIHTAGRGWSRRSTPFVLIDSPKDIKVRVIGVEHGYLVVKILQGADQQAVELAKKPYIHKDGSSAPQVQIWYQHPSECEDSKNPTLQGCKVKELYGMRNFTNGVHSDEWIRSTYGELHSYAEEMVNSVTVWVAPEDLNPVEYKKK